MIKLKDSVFFREYDNKTYITDIHTHREYMLDVPVFAILDLFKEKTSPSQAKDYLSRQYPQVDYCTISDDIDSVVEYMTNYAELMDDHAYPLYNADAARVCLAASMLLQKYA